ncbi:MAG: hypothetical protein H6817_09185 [Phycisphaerales bacterium]|nr:hypothetical protein [Phycisphaerales bacterium]
MIASTHAEFVGGVGFLLIAGATWFFSSRLGLFLRVFSGQCTIADPAAAKLRSKPDQYRKGMRTIALLEAAIGSVLLIVAINK